MTSSRAPALERGDIVEINLDPTAGHEQHGRRRVLILSTGAFNRVTRIAFVAPITQGGDFARDNGFAVSLSGTGLDTQGVVLCHQVAIKDVSARSPRKLERAPDYVVEDVLARVRAILED